MNRLVLNNTGKALIFLNKFIMVSIGLVVFGFVGGRVFWGGVDHPTNLEKTPRDQI